MTSNKIEATLEDMYTSTTRSQEETEQLISKTAKSLNNTYLELVLEIIGEDEEKKVMEWDCPCGTQHHSETSYHNRNGLRAELRNALNQRLGEEEDV